MLRKYKSFLCTLLIMFVAQKHNYFTAKRLFRFIFLTPFRVSEIFFLSKNIKSRVYEFLIHFIGLSTIANLIVANIRSYKILKIEFNHYISNQATRFGLVYAIYNIMLFTKMPFTFCKSLKLITK